MPYYQTWEEFARAAEKLYLTDPMKFLDISNYLVLQTSFYTDTQMKTWKSMEVYNFLYVAGLKIWGSEHYKVRVVLKYRHCDGNLCMKVTDNAVCLQYKTDQAQDVKKIEKLHGKLMRLMVSKESHSGAMETD